jgi:hypothetical protein
MHLGKSQPTIEKDNMEDDPKKLRQAALNFALDRTERA